MKRPKLTRAEQLARHRRTFLLARERGVSLLEAEQLLAREEWQAQQDRLAATRRCGRAIEPARAIGGSQPPLRPIPDDAPWMMRD
ncbi:hypothetical protein [Sphingopyxis alaskensis]|uniref:hypothetical protein n=1 Tax=Sphingopyxis alaskensis TaxID=117207 RepID=UPI00203EECBF|nr:hypothetical protein [Sphingopyxis alaskensis]MCM3419023.1 hypothetical protein [Sphingopyxis alaskensis]